VPDAAGEQRVFCIWNENDMASITDISRRAFLGQVRRQPRRARAWPICWPARQAAAEIAAKPKGPRGYLPVPAWRAEPDGSVRPQTAADKA